MKTIKRAICLVTVLLLLAALPVLSAGAAGVIAEGAAEVSASALNLRSDAGSDATILTTIPRGATVVVLQRETNSWYRVHYSGTTGYVYADYLKNFSSSATLSLSGTVNESDVRIRDKATTDGAILGTASKGASVSVTGIENGWYRISAEGRTGYMRSDYITLSGSGSSSPSGGSSSGSGGSSSGKAGTVTGSYVNFRTGPSTSSSVIRVLSKGTSVTVLEESSGWCRIIHSGTTGYMSSQYVSTASSSGGSSSGSSAASETAMDETGQVTGSYVNFRTGPSTSYRVIATLPRNTEVKVVAKAGSWYKITFNGATGYMVSDYVKIVDKNSALSSSGSGKASDCAAGSVALYSASDLKRMGTFRWNGYRWTWYSEKVLPGGGLRIPGRHVDENGYVCDENGYIVIASHTLSKGTVVATPLGKDGKVYDYCATAGTLDVYVSW